MGRFLGASDFLESPVSQKYDFVDRKAVFRLSSFFVSVPPPARLSHFLFLFQSSSLHTDAAWRSHRHAYTRSSVCMFCGWLCSDSRRSTRGYYIVKPFNYLGKLLPRNIYSPQPALTSVHGYRRVWVYCTLLLHSPSLSFHYPSSPPPLSFS